MPLEQQNFEIMFEGLAQKTSDRTIKAGALTRAQNVEFDKNGQLNKRRGYRRYRFDGAAQIGAVNRTMESQAFRVTTFKDELLIMGHWLWAIVDKNSGVDGRAAVRRGRLAPCNVQTRYIAGAWESD